MNLYVCEELVNESSSGRHFRTISDFIWLQSVLRFKIRPRSIQILNKLKSWLILTLMMLMSSLALVVPSLLASEHPPPCCLQIKPSLFDKYIQLNWFYPNYLKIFTKMSNRVESNRVIHRLNDWTRINKKSKQNTQFVHIKIYRPNNILMTLNEGCRCWLDRPLFPRPSILIHDVTSRWPQPMIWKMQKKNWNRGWITVIVKDWICGPDLPVYLANTTSEMAYETIQRITFIIFIRCYS